MTHTTQRQGLQTTQRTATILTPKVHKHAANHTPLDITYLFLHGEMVWTKPGPAGRTQPARRVNPNIPATWKPSAAQLTCAMTTAMHTKTWIIVTIVIV